MAVIGRSPALHQPGEVGNIGTAALTHRREPPGGALRPLSPHAGGGRPFGPARVPCIAQARIEDAAGLQQDSIAGGYEGIQQHPV